MPRLPPRNAPITTRRVGRAERAGLEPNSRPHSGNETVSYRDMSRALGGHWSIPYEDKPSVDDAILVSYTYKNNSIIKNGFQPGVFGLYDAQTKQMYLTYSSCMLESILGILKEIHMGLHPVFKTIQDMSWNIYSYESYLPFRMLDLHAAYKEQSEKKVYNIINKPEECLLKTYMYFKNDTYDLYLYNKNIDSILIGRFSSLVELVEWQDMVEKTLKKKIILRYRDLIHSSIQETNSNYIARIVDLDGKEIEEDGDMELQICTPSSSEDEE